MASSKVILTGAWPNAVDESMASVTQPNKTEHTRIARRLSGLGFKRFLRLRERIRGFRDPYIKRWQNENAQSQVGNQAAHDDDRKWALRVRSDRVRQRCRQ